jgi:hypothetical protein
MTTDTYERLDAHEIDAVRAYRRRLWSERAERDQDGAREQLVASLRTHLDAWPDAIHIAVIVAHTMRGVRVGDLNTTQRYALISLLEVTK